MVKRSPLQQMVLRQVDMDIRMQMQIKNSQNSVMRKQSIIKKWTNDLKGTSSK